MPLYTVSTQNPLNDTQRLHVVHVITETHCSLTGAPAQYVQVVFAEGIPLRHSVAFHVIGTIRAGRTKAIKNEIVDKIVAGLAGLNGARRKTKVVLFDVPASWVMEGGEIMPEPGEEKH